MKPPTPSNDWRETPLGRLEGVTLETPKFNVDLPAGLPTRETLEAAAREGARLADAATTRDERFLAQQVQFGAEDAVACIDARNAEEAACAGFHAGFYLARMVLAAFEQPAARGEAALRGSRKKGRKAPAGSVRARLEPIAGWLKLPPAELIRRLMRDDPDADPESLRRSIRRAKRNVGQ